MNSPDHADKQPTDPQHEASRNLPQNHKAGFVSIVGKPNVGKSTLMNQLVGERLSIVTHKSQTTRHRIMGILNGEDWQIVYSDTPGILKPEYELHKSMMRFVSTSLEDADIVLFVVELGQTLNEEDEDIQLLKKAKAPVLLILNKIDTAKGTQVTDKLRYWKEVFPEATDYLAVSALDGLNVGAVMDAIINRLPQHPPYFPKDELTDKPERFFAAEIVREKIFLNYKQEIPYSTEVAIEEFKEDDDIIRIRALIYVERNSQKGILIGKGGESLKKVGMQARADMETFFAKQVHLETFVKVQSDWRRKSRSLDQFGYNQ